MSRCYLIAHIDTDTRRVLRVQSAGAFPVAQSGPGACQVMLTRTDGDDYAQAERRLLRKCFGKAANFDYYRWTIPLLDSYLYKLVVLEG